MARLKKPTSFTVDEHISLGNQIKSAWMIQSRLLNHFPKSSRPARALRLLEAALLTLKGALDNEVCQLVPQDKDPRGLATKVYYGTPMVNVLNDDDYANPNLTASDAFAGWAKLDKAVQ
jgi:putative IMPACT (imprinted ancient) family translation regulator